MITIVSGLPRSGTSLMMQMLAAGGMSLLTDLRRKPDIDNPRGYCEWEPIKLLPKDPNLIDEAEGKAVKVISQLLLSLPEGRNYKVIFMERPLPEVLASQDEMLKRRGTEQLRGLRAAEHSLPRSHERGCRLARAQGGHTDLPHGVPQSLKRSRGVREDSLRFPGHCAKCGPNGSRGRSVAIPQPASMNPSARLAS